MLPTLYFLSCFFHMQQIQSNFVIVIHPGSRLLRIGRATDNLPVTIPHVIARRHKQNPQTSYEDSWLLRDGLNVCHSQIYSLLSTEREQLDNKSNPSQTQFSSILNLSWLLQWPSVSFLMSRFFLFDRKQRAMSRDRMDSKWWTRQFGPKRCPMEWGGRQYLLNRFERHSRC